MHDLTIRNGYALFWHEWPSNWTHSPFKIANKTYNCVEQYMMAEKARLFKDTETLAKIMQTSSPAEQKRLGRKVKNFNANKWEKVCYDIVLAGNIEKYRQNKDLCEKLLATGDLIFVEASPKDKIWGIGLDADHIHATNPKRWLGQNLLGKVLNEARQIIRKEKINA